MRKCGLSGLVERLGVNGRQGEGAVLQVARRHQTTHIGGHQAQWTAAACRTTEPVIEQPQHLLGVNEAIDQDVDDVGKKSF